MNLWCEPLWSGETHVLENWVQTKNAWSNSGAPWSTFAKIYDDFWHGREPDWDYLERIVLIDPEIWEAGPEAVAEAIAEIDRTRDAIDRAIDQTTNAERVVLDHDSGKLTTVPVAKLGADFRAEITEEIQEEIALFVEVCGAPNPSNVGGVLKACADRELSILLRFLAKPDIGDLRLYNKIELCVSGLRRRFKAEHLEANPDAVRLVEVLATAALTIIGNSEDVRDAVHGRTEEMFYRLQVEQRAVLQDMVFGMALDSLPELAAQMKADWLVAEDPEATEEARRQAQYNIVSRLPRGARAVNYSRFEDGVQVVPEPEKGSMDKLWWATLLGPAGAVVLSALLNL